MRALGIFHSFCCSKVRDDHLVESSFITLVYIVCEGDMHITVKHYNIYSPGLVLRNKAGGLATNMGLLAQ